MKRITPDNIDELYELINKKIDSYFSFNIKPSSIKKYFKKSNGMERFIKRYNLDEYKNIEKVITDVITDRVAMEEDGILTFESYLTESKDIKDIIFNNIETKDISNFTSYLADYYKTSISYIDIIDKKYNMFNIKSLDLNIDVIFLSESCLQIINENINKYIYDYLKREVINITELGINYEIKDTLSNNINVSKDVTKKIISFLFREDDFQFKTEFKGYLIWER